MEGSRYKPRDSGMSSKAGEVGALRAVKPDLDEDEPPSSPLDAEPPTPASSKPGSVRPSQPVGTKGITSFDTSSIKAIYPSELSPRSHPSSLSRSPVPATTGTSEDLKAVAIVAGTSAQGKSRSMESSPDMVPTSQPEVVPTSGEDLREERSHLRSGGGIGSDNAGRRGIGPQSKFDAVRVTLDEAGVRQSGRVAGGRERQSAEEDLLAAVEGPRRITPPQHRSLFSAASSSGIRTPVAPSRSPATGPADAPDENSPTATYPPTFATMSGSDSGSSFTHSRPTSPPPPPADFNPAPSFPLYFRPISPDSASPSGSPIAISRSASRQGSLGSQSLLAFGSQFGDVGPRSPMPGQGTRVDPSRRQAERIDRARHSGSSTSLRSSAEESSSSSSSSSAEERRASGLSRTARPGLVGGLSSFEIREGRRRGGSHPRSGRSSREASPVGEVFRKSARTPSGGEPSSPFRPRSTRLLAEAIFGSPPSAPIMGVTGPMRSAGSDPGAVSTGDSSQRTARSDTAGDATIRGPRRTSARELRRPGSTFVDPGDSLAVLASALLSGASVHLEEARSAINMELEESTCGAEVVLSPRLGARRPSGSGSSGSSGGGRISPRRSISDGVPSAMARPRQSPPRMGLERRETSPTGIMTLTTTDQNASPGAAAPGSFLALDDLPMARPSVSRSVTSTMRPVNVDDSRWGAVRENRRSPPLSASGTGMSARVASSPLPGFRAEAVDTPERSSSEDGRSPSPADSASARLWDSVWPHVDRGHVVSAASPQIPQEHHEGTLPLHIRSLSTSVIATQHQAPRQLGTLSPAALDGGGMYTDLASPVSDLAGSQLTQALAQTRSRERRGSLAVSHTWPPGRPFPQAGNMDDLPPLSTFSSLAGEEAPAFPRTSSMMIASQDRSSSFSVHSPPSSPVQSRSLLPRGPVRVSQSVDSENASAGRVRTNPATRTPRMPPMALAQGDRSRSVQTPSPPDSATGETQMQASFSPSGSNSMGTSFEGDMPIDSASSPWMPSGRAIDASAGGSPPLKLPSPETTASNTRAAGDTTMAMQAPGNSVVADSALKSPARNSGTVRLAMDAHPGLPRSTSHRGFAPRPMSPFALVTRPRSYSGGNPAPSTNFSATIRSPPRLEGRPVADFSPPSSSGVFEEGEEARQSTTGSGNITGHNASGSSKSKSSSGSSSGRPSGSSGEADDEASPPREAEGFTAGDTGSSEAMGLDGSDLEVNPAGQDVEAEVALPTPLLEDLPSIEDPSTEVDEAMVVPTDALPMDMAFEDEGLTTLERIFLLSKSEFAFHRAYIARMLGDLLEDVDPCETVEYVIPLLNSFAVDEDESVKEAFASDLHRIMWHIFSTCKITDDSGPESPDVVPNPVSEETARTPGQVVTITSEGIKTVRRPTFDGVYSELGPPTRSAGSTDDVSPRSGITTRSTSTSTLTTGSTPGTLSTPDTFVDTPSSTLSSQTTVSEQTAFSSAAMVSPRGAGAGETFKDAGPLINRPAIAVHVFTPMLGSMLLSQNSLVADPARSAVVSILAKLRGKTGPLSWQVKEYTGSRQTFMSQSGVHQHDEYPFTLKAKGLIERELLTEIVLGIGRLDGDSMDVASLQRTASRFTLESEDLQLNTGVHVAGSSEATAEDRPGMSRTQSRSSSSAFGLDRAEGTGTDGSLTSSEAAMFKMQLSQEAMLGRAISMNLLASVAEYYSEEEIERFEFIPQVLRTATDEPGVKTEAALALAYLAKHASEDAVDSLLELFESFAGDPIDQVRQAACLCLPALARRITDLQMKRDYVVEAYTNLVYSGDLVQYTSLEILGEIIHLFHDDPDGTPVDLLEVFLSQASEHEQVDSLNAAINPDEGIRSFSQYRREFDDLDRAAISAFNFPAVCLALGRAGWFQIRQTYRALCNINHPRVTRSLAGSIHEIAKIIGPDFTASDLLEPFYEFLHGSDELQERVLQNVSELFGSLPPTDALDAVKLLTMDWETGAFRNWRHRELLAGQVAKSFEAHSPTEDMTGACIEILRCFLFDTYEAVRMAAVNQIPMCLKALSQHPDFAQSLLGVIHELGAHAAFKRRRTFMACLGAFLDQGTDIAFFEAEFMRYLTPLSDDLLDVRIGLAHLVSQLCSAGGLYADVVVRSLPLAEVIERLRNDDSPYVRKPLESVHPKPMPMYQNPSGGWHGPLGDVWTPGQASGTSSGGTPGGRRSSSASMILARAESDSTIVGLRNVPLDSAGTGNSSGEGSVYGRLSGAQSAPASYRSPDIWYSPARVHRRHRARKGLSDTSRYGSTPEEVPVQVGMRDIFAASFSEAVHNRDLLKKSQGGSE